MVWLPGPAETRTKAMTKPDQEIQNASPHAQCGLYCAQGGRIAGEEHQALLSRIYKKASRDRNFALTHRPYGEACFWWETKVK
jgi:hypothetical protein